MIRVTGIKEKGRTATVLLRGSNKLVLEVRPLSTVKDMLAYIEGTCVYELLLL